MNFKETAKCLRRLADAMDTAVAVTGNDPDNGRPKPAFGEEEAVAAASILCYIRDLVTASPREDLGKAEFLVLLEQVSRDAEIFPCSVGVMIWEAQDENEPTAAEASGQ